MKYLLKKSTGMFLVFALLLCSLPVLAAENANLEQAIASAKSRIEIPAELTEFNSDIITEDDSAVYTLEWHNEDNSQNLSLSVNDKNDIISYYYNDGKAYDSSIKFSSFSDEEIFSKAIEWLTQINPTWIPELDTENYYIRDGGIYSSNSSVIISRIKDGVSFLDNRVTINLNNRTGAVTDFYSSWDYADAIPSASEAMTIETAADEYFKLSPLELIYVDANDGTAKLVYSPTAPHTHINARKGGEIVSQYHKDTMTEEAAADMATASSGGASNGLTQGELNNVNEIGSLIPEEELVALAKGLKHTGLDSAEYKGINYTKSYAYTYRADSEETYAARLRFVFNPYTDDEYSASVLFDAATGELISYNAYDYNHAYNEETAAVSAETALKTAEEFLGQTSAEYKEKVKNNSSEKAVVYNGYSFNFVRYENDIPFYNNSISIGVNSSTGRISSYHKSWDEEIVFENTDGVIDLAAAKEKFIQNIGFELSYVYDYSARPEGDVELCYFASSDKKTQYIDAKTGEAATYLIYDYQTIQPTDITGHYAEKQIQALVDAGVIELTSDSPQYRPDDTITYSELAQLTLRLMIRYYMYDFFEVESYLRSNNVVLPGENFIPDAAATRADGAMYIVRALGYGEVAELAGIFNCLFTDADDIPEDKAGYIAIANGFGIIRGDENGAANANDPLSRADAAIMIYNYLAR